MMMIVRDVGVSREVLIHNCYMYKVSLYMFSGSVHTVANAYKEEDALNLASGLAEQLNVSCIKEYDNGNTSRSNGN